MHKRHLPFYGILISVLKLGLSVSFAYARIICLIGTLYSVYTKWASIHHSTSISMKKTNPRADASSPTGTAFAEQGSESSQDGHMTLHAPNNMYQKKLWLWALHHDNYLMDCHEILYRHLWSPDDESYWLWWAFYFSPSATSRSKISHWSTCLNNCWMDCQTLNVSSISIIRSKMQYVQYKLCFVFSANWPMLSR